MGGLSHLFDEDSMARKVFAQKKHVQGLEAPRNSLDLQIEASENCAAGDLQYSRGVKEFRSARMRNQSEASMKKLIKDEMLNRPAKSRHRSPSVVARLMGMDVLPADSSSEASKILKEKENTKRDTSIRKKNLSSSRQAARNPSYSDLELNTESNRRKANQNDERVRRQEHPQEEELQKFKKEFEAWQTARFRECSQSVNLDRISTRSGSWEKPNQEIMRVNSSDRDYMHKFEIMVPEENGGFGFPMRNFENKNIGHRCATISGQKSYDFLHPTRIVILKPGPDRVWSNDESLTSSSGSDERGSIEDFLQEVKERLRCELQGRALKKSSAVRGSGIETPFKEKPLDPKGIAHNIANQVRESIGRDNEVNLRRSGSTRSYRSEMHLTEPWSPEFINRDTRKFLSQSLRNVLKGERYSNIPEESCNGSTSHFVDPGWDKNGRKRNFVKNSNQEHEIQVRSFRHGSNNDVSMHRELSPRNLVRSLSAPVSGTSFGKLLLEDRHVLTGAHIRRKQEAGENLPRDAKKTKRERFNFKERVHNIKYTLTLRRRLLGKRIPSVKESKICESDLFKDMLSGPTVITNFGDKYENSTEVPPSPASVCSSAQDEFWRPSSNLSPISTPDISLEEEDAIPRVFREISMNLNELRRQLNQLGSDEPIDTPTAHWNTECAMVELDDKIESYIRDLLVASGLYDGSPDLCLLKLDSLIKPISDLAFEEVEQHYGKLESAKEDDIAANDKKEKGTTVNHKLLHDLLNEILPSVLLPGRRKNACFTQLIIPRGSDLLSSVWGIIREFIYPKAEKSSHSTDSMASQDLESTPWLSLLDDQVNILGRELEGLMVEDLIEEILRDMQVTGCK